VRVITRWTLAAEALARWETQYGGELERRHPKFKRIRSALANLGPNPHPDRVDEIIGNYLWTVVPVCYECEERWEKRKAEFKKTNECGDELFTEPEPVSDAVVHFGQESNYESRISLPKVSF
jgi:hypothetical protein